MEEKTENWDLVIKPHNKWWDLQLQAIWRYRDLLMLFVRRDFVAQYKQTILGPIWFFIQPAITALTFTIIFGNLAQVPTDGLPQVLFYLAGITVWTYFSDTLTKTADTFTANAAMFGKVYFPRMIVPLSIVVSNIVKLAVQFLLFIIVWFFYIFKEGNVHPNALAFMFPFLIFLLGFLGLGFGIIITSLTTKYRDLKFLIVFAVQLLMYASPVVYPASIVPKKYELWIWLNPLTSIIEATKYGFLGTGIFSWFWLAYSFVFIVFLFLLGIIIFNKVEKSFMDTV